MGTSNCSWNFWVRTLDKLRKNDVRPSRTKGRIQKVRPFVGVAPREGLEPPTNWLTANCSTD